MFFWNDSIIHHQSFEAILSNIPGHPDLILICHVFSEEEENSFQKYEEENEHNNKDEMIDVSHFSFVIGKKESMRGRGEEKSYMFVYLRSTW